MAISKQQFIFFFIALAILAGFAFIGTKTSTPKADIAAQQALWPSREVSSQTITEASAAYSIDAAYPVTASDSITTYFKSFVEDQISGFKTDTAWVEDFPESAQGTALSLDISYTSTQATHVQTYVFVVNLYTGGAHGMQIRKTFAFNKDGQLLSLSNIFSDEIKGLVALSDAAQKEVLKKEGTDASWVRDGAGPVKENYANFIVTDTAVTVLFDPYQVGPYVLGAIDVTVPLSAFRGYANTALFAEETTSQ